MSESPKQPKPEEGTTILHLHKFAPGEETSAEPEPDTGENPTLFIRKTAAEAADQSSQPVGVPEGAGALPPKKMLGAVAYCYAKGVYSSEDIERKMITDPQLRSATHGELPTANAIRRFRRLNRRLIQATLERALRFLRRHPQTADDSSAPATSASSDQSREPATQPESDTVVVRREAGERIDNAILLDTLRDDS